MTDSETRVLTLVPPSAAETVPARQPVETGLADVVTLQRQREAQPSAQDEESFFVDTISEYQWARQG
ncbi:hypothetical protein ACNPQM_40650 [Streptomyces sp. NPDC056231]|uniref:hypothetical protein n=1 Tax=unclassified Streptomyces TaxID=2593676 RepID=UPI0033E24E6B